MPKVECKTRGGGSHKKFVLLLLGIAVGLLFLSIVLINVTREPNDLDKVPLYEEVYGTSKPLRSAINGIDKVIFSALYSSGISQKDVHFISVEPRQEKGEIWELTKVLVKCDGVEKVQRVKREIVKGIKSRLGSWVHIKQVQANPMVVVISIKGRITHELTFPLEPDPTTRPKSKPKVALIIDDMGYAHRLAHRFMALGNNITLSILPGAPFTRTIALEARERGCEVMLHLPLEPKGYPGVNPGPGCLFTNMGREEMARTLDSDLSQVPGADGINNHMGSLFTEDEEAMRALLCELKSRDLFFIDSRTTPMSKGYDMARAMGIQAAKRNVFIDNNLDKLSIETQLSKLLSMASRTGWAIGIGHPHEQTVEALEEFLHEKSCLFELVPVSRILKEMTGAECEETVRTGG